MGTGGRYRIRKIAIDASRKIIDKPNNLYHPPDAANSLRLAPGRHSSTSTKEVYSDQFGVSTNVRGFAQVATERRPTPSLRLDP